MSAPETPSLLVCPITKSPLRRDGDFLVSAEGRKYPIMDGIPILLPTAAVASDSESRPGPTPDPGSKPA